MHRTMIICSALGFSLSPIQRRPPTVTHLTEGSACPLQMMKPSLIREKPSLIRANHDVPGPSYRQQYHGRKIVLLGSFQLTIVFRISCNLWNTEKRLFFLEVQDTSVLTPPHFWEKGGFRSKPKKGEPRRLGSQV